MTYPYHHQTKPQVSKKGRRGILVASVIGAIILIGLCVGVGILTDGSGSSKIVQTPSDVRTTPSPKATTDNPLLKGIMRDEDTPLKVGEDLPAGIYRVTESVAGRSCYWMKSSDSEGSNIIKNDVPQGGRPQVTLQKGQWFTSQDCGEWHKQ